MSDRLLHADPVPAYVRGQRETRGLVAFDEREWPPAPVFAEAYEARVRSGRERMAETRVVLAGLARDVESRLPLNLARLEQLGQGFADYRIVVYENDSVDGTAKLLADAAARNPRIHTRSDQLGGQRWPSVRDLGRAAAMADYRTRLQADVLAVAPDFDHVIVVDLDLDGWSYDGVANAFGHEGWDVMASSGVRFRAGRPFFYDGWAFRTVSGPHRKYTFHTMVFPRGTSPIPVRSAFSGLAIYAMSAFAAGRYGGEDCEHVVFHDSLARAGFGRIFLNPSMISLHPDYEERSA